MLLKLNEPLMIEDMQHHSTDRARRLRELLLRGVEASTDPHRRDFYDVEDNLSVYYMHVCPSGKVLLLAVWAKEGAPLHASAASHAASASAL